jgi:cell division protein FtsB
MILAVIRRRRVRAGKGGVPDLVAGTEALVGELVKQVRALRSENARLSREVERLSDGWEKIRSLARSAPRRPRR